MENYWLFYAEKAYTVEDVIKYQAELSILPSHLCIFHAQKIHLEDATDVTSFTFRSFWHVATIHGCMFHFFYSLEYVICRTLIWEIQKKKKKKKIRYWPIWTEV